MNKITLSILVLGMTLAAGRGSAQDRELGGSGQLLDGIAALVGTGVVLKSEVRDRLQTVADNFLQQQLQLPPDQRSQLPPISLLEQQVLDQMILEEIEVQHAESAGVVISDDVLNQVLSQIAMNVGTTLQDLPSWMESQGIDYARFREDQRRDLMIRQIERRDVVDHISIDKHELEQCIANSTASQSDNYEYNVSHILIGFSANATKEQIAAAEERARDIERKLDEGSDFAELAAAYSDSQTALEGGALGWRKGSALPTIFANDVRSMQVGDHSQPIRAAGGFHIVKLNDKRGDEPQLVDQVHARGILLKTTEVLDDDAIRQKLIGIREQLLNGDDFATIAEAVSEDQRSAAKGGDLGWAEYSSFDPDLATRLKALDIDEISEPFKTPAGWQIIQVTGRRSYDMTDDLIDQHCRQQLGDAKLGEAVDDYHRRIRDEAFIEKHP